MPPDRCVNLGRPELLEFAERIGAFHGIDLARVSALFLAQTYQIYASESLNLHKILDEIRWLEGTGRKTVTKPEDFFNERTVLAGLYYKHFTDERFVLQNLVSEFGYERGGNKELNRIIHSWVRGNSGRYISATVADDLAYETTIDAWRRRAQRRGLTGEWIVIKKRGGSRYYLCLAAHNEDNDTIRDRVIDACRMDFPFLQESV